MNKTSRNATTEKDSKTGIIMIVIAALLLVSVIVYVVADNKKASDGSALASTSEAVEPEATAADGVVQEDGSMVYSAGSAAATPVPDNAIELPHSVDDGRLNIVSLFPFTGMNPDADMADCDEVAAVQLTNTSGQYLTRADISIELADGTSLSFVIMDVPAGAEVYAFDVNNTSGVTGNAVTDISVNAEYSDAPALPDGVTVSVDGTAITLTNTGSTAYDSFTVVYHNAMDDVLFGGTSYSVSVSLPANGTATADASEAWLGMATVVSGK